MKTTLEELIDEAEYKLIVKELKSLEALAAFNTLCNELANLRAEKEYPDSER